MATLILDPTLRESMEAGSTAFLSCWLAAEGDYVDEGQAVARAELVQENVEVTAPHAGILDQIFVEAGERFIPGQALGHMVEV